MVRTEIQKDDLETLQIQNIKLRKIMLIVWYVKKKREAK